jgi:hypothetical protein
MATVGTMWTDPSTSGALDLGTGGVMTEAIYKGILSNIKHKFGARGFNGIYYFLNAPLAIANNAEQAIGWTLANYDDGTAQLLGTTAFMAPEAGIYYVWASLAWAAFAAGGTTRMCRFLVSRSYTVGLSSVYGAATSAFAPYTGNWLTAFVKLGAGEYVECMAFQDSGGSLTLIDGATSFGAIRVGALL